MSGFKNWALGVLIALDQVVCALLGGFPDETLSSYAYRLDRDGKPWGVTRRWIDALFGQGHCAGAYEAELYRRQEPPEFRRLP